MNTVLFPQWHRWSLSAPDMKARFHALLTAVLRKLGDALSRWKVDN